MSTSPNSQNGLANVQKYGWSKNTDLKAIWILPTAITYKKTGWDCMRHYEILMNGCIPLFLDIESCPKKIMEDIPKQRLIEIKNRFQYNICTKFA